MIRKWIQEYLFKKFVVSQLVPSWLNGKPVFKDWSTEKAIAEGFKSSTWVYACVTAIAKAASSVPWYVYNIDVKGDYKLIPNHPLELLINRPNPFSSRKHLMELMTAHLYLGGDSYFTKARAGNGIVAELWNLPPDKTAAVQSQTDFLSHYEFRIGKGRPIRIERKDMMHNMFLDPSNPYKGLAPLQAASRIVDSDVEAIKWNITAMQNRAVTDGIFTFEQALTKSQWEEARTQVREQHQGSKNAHSPWVLGGNAKWQQMSLSPVEMDFILSRKMTREEICAIFRVPPPIVGIYDYANYKVETARKIFWLDTVVPYLSDVRDCFNSQLTPDFGRNLYLDYDLSNVEALQENFSDKMANAKSLWQMGVPFNVINQRLDLGLDDVEGGDVGYLPTGVMPTDLLGEGLTPSPMANPPKAKPPKVDEKPSVISVPQMKMAIKGVNLKSEEQKDYYWKSFENQRNLWYLRIARKGVAIFTEQGNVIAEAFLDGDTQGIQKAFEDGKDEWNGFLRSAWTSLTEEFGKRVFDSLKSMGPSETKEEQVEFDPFKEEIMSYISEITASKVINITDTSRNKIMQLIYTMRNDSGYTADDIARAIKKEFEDFSRYRAWMIARTEVVGASNHGSFQGAKQSGVVLKKEWITSLDDRVRERHKEMHGKIVGLEDKFGNDLTFPGEYIADAPSDTINCRCVMAYITA